MTEITNHNCAGICSQRLCDEVQTQFKIIKLQDMEVIIGFCDKHTEELEDSFFKARREDEE